MTAKVQMYYIRDRRQTVGNCVMWWREGGNGYTCNLDEAGKYTEAAAFHKRDTDIPVPVEVAEAAAVRHVRGDAPAMEMYWEKPVKVKP